MNAYQVVKDFEMALSEYTGAPYVRCVDSCTNAILICLTILKEINDPGYIKIPKRTYPSVPCSIIRSGMHVEFTDIKWVGSYRLEPFNLWDCAKSLKREMYIPGEVQCLSFHGKKHLPIGRGGAILTDNKDFTEKATWMRFDGRPEGRSLSECELQGIGFNCYMTPEQAARGLELLQFAKDEYPEEYEAYQDLSKYEFYK